MPADKQSALAALDLSFTAAVQSAAGTLYASSAGKAMPDQIMLNDAERALRLAKLVDTEMRAVVDKVFKEP